MKMLLIFFALLFSSSIYASTNVDKAIDAVRVLCLAGTGYNIEVSGDASLNVFKRGVDGDLRFSKEELNGVVDVPDDDKRYELENIRSCIKPHISRILDSLLPTEAKKKTEVKEKYMVKIKGFPTRPNQGSGISLSIYVDGEYVDDMTNLRGVETIRVGKLEEGFHEFSFQDIDAYFVNGFGQYQRIPEASGLDCEGDFRVSRSKTYKLLVWLDQSGLTCDLR